MYIHYYVFIFNICHNYVNSISLLFLIEATSDEIGKGDRIILDKIKGAKRKTILIIL